MVEIQCETDFVARNDDFQDFAREVAIHIAGSPNVPQYVSVEEIPEEAKEAERRVFAAKAAEEGKPEDIIQKIVDGQISKWSQDVALLEQEHIRTDMHEGKTIEDLRQALAANTGENIRIARFARFQSARNKVPAGLADPVFKRVLLKLSGEALMGELEYGTDAKRLDAIAHQVRDVAESGVEVAVVVGAGNIYRGLKGAAAGMDRATADYMGMLATVLNALTLQDALEKIGSFTRVLSAIQVTEVAEPYIRRRAIRHLEKGRVVIFAAGTGNPFFTTDTAAALRALEIHADAILMAKRGVEGVFDADPSENPDATFLPELTHMEAIERGLKVMDSTALSLCMDNELPIHVFNLDDERNIDRIVRGERVGTIVK